ncbi:MAG: hypothetical protein GY847_28375 [Proteobacteria bacterium]|nr:hypothetical protein [Pseudomonadota bacterium]
METSSQPIRTPVRTPIRTPVRMPVKQPIRKPMKKPLRTPVPKSKDEQTLSKESSTATADLQLDEAIFIIDRCVQRADHFGLMEAARILKLHPRIFIEWLRTERYLFGKGNRIQIRTSAIAAGLLEAKVSTEWEYSRPMMTFKGICHFAIMKMRGLIPERVRLQE